MSLDFNPSTFKQAERRITGEEAEAGFRNTMINAGLEPPAHLISDGTLHRYHVHSDAAGSKNGWYTLHLDGIPAGAFGCWKRGIEETWIAREYQSLTPQEKASHKAKMEAAKQQRDAEKARMQAECREWCEKVLSTAKDAPQDHPYLKCKGVQPHGLKVKGDSLLVPVLDITGKIHGIQFINQNGEKRFKSATDKFGHFYPTGRPTDNTAIICEGFATGATIHEATGLQVLVAFDAGNLKPVAEAVRAKRPGHKIIIAADDDHATEGNPGLTKAKEAAQAVGGFLAVPQFPESRGPKDTDFNDLAQMAGLDSVRKCIEGAMVTPDILDKSQPQRQLLKVKTMSELLNTAFPEIRWVIFGLLPEGLAILSGPPKIGKSWLVMNLCLAASTGGFVFGKFKVEQCEVLLGSLEDNERRLQGRLRKCLEGSSIALDKFHATTVWRRLDQGGLQDLVEWLEQHPDCRLVVFDTIQKIKPLPKRKNGTAYENDYDCYGDLQRIALQFNCCILVIHHNRKSSSKDVDDPYEQISGSTGITGAMDTILMLRRPRGASEAILTATGRDISEAQYTMTFDGAIGQWVVMDKMVEEIRLKEDGIPSRILAAIREMGGNATIDEVHIALGGTVTVGTVKTNLYRLIGKGLLCRLKDRFIVTSVTEEESVTGVTNVTKGSNSVTSNIGNTVSLSHVEVENLDLPLEVNA